MSLSAIGMIFSAIVFLAVFVGAVIGVRKLQRKIQSFSRMAFGTSDILKGLKQVELETSSTPKSVAAMTSLYLPKIKKDFPEFQYDEMKVRAENALTSYLLAINGMQASLLSEGGPELKEKLAMKISMLRDAQARESYQEIKLHRTELADYKKRNGRCIITFQTAVQYHYTKTDQNGKLLEGNRDLYTQSKYNISVIYIQDRNLVEKETDYSLGINCPNCGAPVSGLGSKVCAYCGTPIVELNIYAWTFSNIEEVT